MSEKFFEEFRFQKKPQIYISIARGRIGWSRIRMESKLHRGGYTVVHRGSRPGTLDTPLYPPLNVQGMQEVLYYITANLYCICLSGHVLKQMLYRFAVIYGTLSIIYIYRERKS